VIGVRDTRRTRLVLVVLLVAALGLIALDYSDGNSSLLRGIRHVSGAVFGGVEHGVGSVTGFFGGSSSNGQVTALQREVAQLRAELSAAQLSRSDYQELHKLLDLAGQGRYRVVAATVIAVGQGYQQTVTLDVGSADGVRTDQTVVNGEGLVGQVTAVTSTTCTVLLATDASSVVGVALAPSGDYGKLTGSGDAAAYSDLLQLQVYDSTANLTVGEAMVTAASVNDQPFVPGVPVGTIAKVLNKAGSLTPLALVRPYVDFAALGVVGVVIQPPAHNPHFSVLPPIPHPLPAVTVTVTRSPRPTATPTPTPTLGA
jgi:rod shape-determining protein MreC